MTEPEPYVAIPAVQQLSYCYDSEELRELYANLLVSSMNVDTKHYVYPSFVDIIKQLSPMDAKVLEAMKQEQSPIPVVTVRLNFKESKSYHELLIDYSIDLFQLFGDTSILSASLVKPDERYDVFYEDAEYKGLVASFQGKENTDITLSKGLIELTEFGKAFCKSCCED